MLFGMLQQIQSLHKIYVGTSPTGRPVESLPPLLVAQELIRAMGAAYNVQKAQDLKTDFYFSECTDSKRIVFNVGVGWRKEGNFLLISPLLLADKSKLPKMDTFSKVEVQNYADALCRQLNIKEHVLSDSEWTEFNLYFLFINKNPELAKEGIRYILAHELGHIHHGDIGCSKILVNMFISALSTAIACTIALPFIIGAVALFPLSVPLFACSVVVIQVAVVAGSYFIKNKLRKSYNHFIELRADAFAVQNKKALEGAKYYHQFRKTYDKEIDIDGDSHPSNSYRLSLL